MSNGRIYVGNLPTDVQRRDLEDLFNKYGKINLIELKNYGGSVPFAFIQYDDPRDAHDAVCGRNGFEFGDAKLRVEYPRGEPQGGGARGGFPMRGRGFAMRGGRGGPKTRRSDYRVIVTGLPPSGSWQDLKDHMREAGDICFTDVQRSGDGIVEFVRREDMEYAIRRLDRTEFRSHQGETSFIRVFEDRTTPSFDRSRSRSRSRGRYSPQYYGRGSSPSRYSPPPRYEQSRRDPPSRRFQSEYSPPSRRYW